LDEPADTYIETNIIIEIKLREKVRVKFCHASTLTYDKLSFSSQLKKVANKKEAKNTFKLTLEGR
jgi:hypothetical protein